MEHTSWKRQPRPCGPACPGLADQVARPACSRSALLDGPSLGLAPGAMVAPQAWDGASEAVPAGVQGAQEERRSPTEYAAASMSRFAASVGALSQHASTGIAREGAQEGSRSRGYTVAEDAPPSRSAYSEDAGSIFPHLWQRSPTEAESCFLPGRSRGCVEAARAGVGLSAPSPAPGSHPPSLPGSRGSHSRPRTPQEPGVGGTGGRGCVEAARAEVGLSAPSPAPDSRPPSLPGSRGSHSRPRTPQELGAGDKGGSGCIGAARADIGASPSAPPSAPGSYYSQSRPSSRDSNSRLQSQALPPLLSAGDLGGTRCRAQHEEAAGQSAIQGRVPRLRQDQVQPPRAWALDPLSSSTHAGSGGLRRVSPPPSPPQSPPPPPPQAAAMARAISCCSRRRPGPPPQSPPSRTRTASRRSLPFELTAAALGSSSSLSPNVGSSSNSSLSLGSSIASLARHLGRAAEESEMQLREWGEARAWAAQKWRSRASPPPSPPQPPPPPPLHPPPQSPASPSTMPLSPAAVSPSAVAMALVSPSALPGPLRDPSSLTSSRIRRRARQDEGSHQGDLAPQERADDEDDSEDVSPGRKELLTAMGDTLNEGSRQGDASDTGSADAFKLIYDVHCLTTATRASTLRLQGSSSQGSSSPEQQRTSDSPPPQPEHQPEAPAVTSGRQQDVVRCGQLRERPMGNTLDRASLSSLLAAKLGEDSRPTSPEFAARRSRTSNANPTPNPNPKLNPNPNPNPDPKP